MPSGATCGRQAAAPAAVSRSTAGRYRRMYLLSYLVRRSIDEVR